MKKIFTVLCLMALTLGAQAQTPLMEGYGNPLTLDQFKALVGTGQRFGFVASSNTAGDTAPRCDHWCGFTSTHNTTTLSDDYLFYLEASDGNYLVKRVSDDQYVITNSGSTSFGASGTAFKLVNRDPNDATKAVTGAQSISFEDPSNSAVHYNANAVKMNNGPGAWTTYAVFGPIYKNITIDCQLNGTSMDGYPQTFDYKAGTVDAPEFVGSKLVDGQQTSVEISEDNQTITFNYESSSFDYTLVVNGAPEGTTITIKGTEVSAGTVSFEEEVAESDVVVAFPTDYSKWSYNVSISGTTITVTAREPWYVSFDKETLRSTHASRYTDKIGFTSGQEITFEGAVGDLIWRDLTSQELTVPTGATLTPLLGYRGWAMYGYLYIDYNNDGDFSDEGELVSQLTGNTWASGSTADKTIPEFTITSTPGTYRARYKVEWNNPNPHEIGSNIAENGGCVIDVMINVASAADVTFKVVDAENNILHEETASMAIGETVSELPSSMTRAFTTYTYPDGEITVSATGENVFTAVATFDLPFEPFTNYDEAQWYYMTIRGNKYVSMSDSEPYPTTTTNAETDAYQWSFAGNPYAGIKVYNKAAGSTKTLTKESNPVLREGEYSWTILSNSDGFILKETGTDHNSINEVNGKIGFWNNGYSLTDNGSTFRLSKVPENTITYINALDQLDNNKVYAIYNVRAMWKFDNALSVDPIAGIDLDEAYTNPGNHQIAIVKQNDKFYLYSVTDQKYLASNNKLYDSPLESVNIVASTSAAAVGNYKWFFSFDGYTDRNINTNGTPAIEINYWNSHDIGNINAIMETTGTYNLDDALAAFSDYTQCITDYCDLKGISTDFASHIGELGYPKAGTDATNAFTNILDRNASGENTADDWSTFVEKFDAVKAADNVRLPEVGNFYRIKGIVSGRYMQSNVSPENANRLGSTEDGTDATTIFYYDEGNKLLGFNNGIYTKNTCEAAPIASNASDAQAYTITVPTLGEFAIKGGGFLYSWPTSENKSYFDRNGNTYHERCRMVIEEVTELPVTMNDGEDGKYYATFSAPVAISSITGATAHKVKVENEKAKYSETGVEGIPAGTGVLLINETGDDAMLTIGDFTDAIDTDLRSITAAVSSHEGLFFGLSTENKLGFFKLMEEGGETAPTTGGFKAYLDGAVTPTGAKGVELVADNEATGVEAIDGLTPNPSPNGKGSMYNLQGQRVNKAQKGVFIQNGKKVVVR